MEYFNIIFDVIFHSVLGAIVIVTGVIVIAVDSLLLLSSGLGKINLIKNGLIVVTYNTES